ncbi:unnamed protein product [Urochloa humidicola]
MPVAVRRRLLPWQPSCFLPTSQQWRVRDRPSPSCPGGATGGNAAASRTAATSRLPPLCSRPGRPLVLGKGDGEHEPILPVAPRRCGDCSTVARLDLASGGAAPARLHPGTAIAPSPSGVTSSSSCPQHRIRRHPLPVASILCVTCSPDGCLRDGDLSHVMTSLTQRF